MKIRIFAAIMLSNVSLAQAQLNLLPGDATVAPAATDQTAPALSRGSDSTLVVWTDNRANPNGPYTWSEHETSRDIYGVRLDGAGNVLESLPIAIVAARANQNYPKVAWNGSSWLVVYQSMDVGGTGYYQDSLEAVRVAPSGQVLDIEPIKLYGLAPSGPSYWALASDGNNWVVVNQGTPTGGDIVAVRISPAGVMLDPPTRSLVPATYYMRSNIQVAHSAGVLLCTFNDAYGNGGTDTKAVRFDSNLNKLDTGLISILATPLSALAGNSNGFYAVWNRQEPDFSVHVVGSRVNTVGVKLDGNGVNLSGTKQPYAYAAQAVAWDGANWRVTWGEYAMTYVARVTGAGALLDPGSVGVPGVQAGATTGNGAGGLQVVWTDYVNANNEVVTANIAPDNVGGTARTISVAAPQQSRPDVAASDDGFLVVYRSTIDASSRVLAQPLDAAGNPLTVEPIQLDAGPSFNGPGNPSVAWNGAVYLVAWAQYPNGVVGQRLSPAGVKIDPSPFVVIGSAVGPADVAAIGNTFLVAARKYGYSPQYIDCVAARVRGSDGVVIDPSPLFPGGGYVSRPPVVTTLGGRFYVAFITNWGHNSSSASTAGAFVPVEGPAMPSQGIHLFSTAGGNGIIELGLASSGNTALLVQSAEVTSGVENDMIGFRIDVNGAASPLINFTPWPGNQYRPHVEWDGTNFIIAYQDQKNRLALNTLDQLDARSDLFAMRVSSTGTIIDPQGFVFSARPTAETDPTVAALNGTLFMAGSLMVNDATFANYRIAYDLLPGNGPVAVINASAMEGDVPLAVNFNSAGSTGVSYAWNFGDGGTAATANPSHTFTVAGEFLVRLTVTDGAGRQTVQAQRINATPPNQVPVAIATADVYSGNLPFDVIFYAAQSYDPDGFIGNIEWLFSDGGSYWGATAYHTFTEPGPQTVTLNCYDARGGVGTTNLIINADGANLPPIVNASATPTSGSPPLIVQFSSAGSSDPDGSIVAYHWTFGDASGVFSNEANPTYTYGSAGTYAATLTVTDNNSVSRSDTVIISVTSNHYVEYGVNLSLGPTHYIEHYEQGALPVGPIIEEDVIAGYGRVAGTANVGFGVNKARVDLAGTNPDNPFFFEYGFATSRYWDSFQFDDPQLNGTHGFFDVTLYVAGSGSVNLSDGYLLSPDTTFDAFWHAVINVSVDGVMDPNGSTIQSVYYAGQWYKDLDMTSLDYYGDALDTYQQTATLEFIYGQPIFMDSFLQVDTYFDNQISSVAGTLDSVIDLGNSSYWGGIRNLRDSQGNPVSAASYSSSSGFDYRQTAVPPSVPPSVTQGDDGIARNRCLSLLTIPQAGPTALRVTLDSLHHVSPPYTGGQAADFSAFEGQVRWIGPPTQYVESTSGGIPFQASQLQCTPYYQDWSTVGLLHVFGSAVVPSSLYRVETVASSCQGFETNCVAVSVPLVVTTARWGDVEVPYNPPSPTAQPDIGDISALANKFMNMPGAPIKARALLAGSDRFGNIDISLDLDFSDIAVCVDAFRGNTYPYTIATCP